jgi:glycine/serine hydroxymethyltransferase
MQILKDKMNVLANKIIANNIWRQRECINLIPSENTPSLLVKLCEICDPSGRYAEHRTMKGEEIYFYQGINFIKDIESELNKELATYFNCPNIESRPLSGQMANEIIFKAMLKYLNKNRKEGEPFKRMKLVMNNALNKGGHLSSQPMGALFNYVEENPTTRQENVINFPVMKDNLYKIDTDSLLEILAKEKPELIVFGKSMFLYKEPVEQIYNLIKDWPKRPVIMYDMAHVLGLYGAFQEPFKEGADIVTGSTHKTFFGPQRGIIASSINEKSPFNTLWTEIKNRTFPGSTSNHHLGTMVALLAATYEMNAFKNEYQKQVINNAKAFAKYLKENGVKVEGDEQDGYTETHQVIIRVKDHGSGNEIAKILENNNIIVNYQALPDDESFLQASGIRMGVQEMTRFGMVEKDFEQLSVLIADVVINKLNVKSEVIKLREKFLEMKYCLPANESIPLIGKIFSSIVPKNDYIKMFVDSLNSINKL